MSYLLACVRSWWWHLTYGMWKGYRETRVYECVGPDGETRGRLVALYSTDSEHCVKKTFWLRRTSTRVKE